MKILFRVEILVKRFKTYITITYFQIGLPREHTSALCKVYSDKSSQITKVLKNESLQIGRLNDVEVSKEKEGEYVMKLNYANMPKGTDENKFTLTRDQIQLLIFGMFNNSICNDGIRIVWRFV